MIERIIEFYSDLAEQRLTDLIDKYKTEKFDSVDNALELLRLLNKSKFKEI